MDERASSHSYEERILNLTDGTGTDDRANGSIFLNVDGTVKDDTDKDMLTGSADFDWFFANEDDDRITDLHDDAFANDIDFILS